MNTTTNSKTSKALTSPASTSSVKQKFSQSKMPTIAGISLPEIAVLGAAGFIIWKNREKVQTFLTDNGIEVPNFLSGDLSELIQSGVSLIGNKNADRPAASSARRTHDA